jgi:dUTP pyrophosphatase
MTVSDESSAGPHDPTPSVIFEPLYDDVPIPIRTTGGSAGYDLRAYLKARCVKTRHGSTGELRTLPITGATVTLEPQDIALIPTGFRACLPAGYEAQIRLRSSIAFRRGLIIPNAPATIDADYPDEWLVMVKNDTLSSVQIAHGERIAQAVLNRFAPLPWRQGTVEITTDRIGGLGSTGTS